MNTNASTEPLDGPPLAKRIELLSARLDQFEAQLALLERTLIKPDPLNDPTLWKPLA